VRPSRSATRASAPAASSRSTVRQAQCAAASASAERPAASRAFASAPARPAGAVAAPNPACALRRPLVCRQFHPTKRLHSPASIQVVHPERADGQKPWPHAEAGAAARCWSSLEATGCSCAGWNGRTQHVSAARQSPAFWDCCISPPSRVSSGVSALTRVQQSMRALPAHAQASPWARACIQQRADRVAPVLRQRGKQRRGAGRVRGLDGAAGRQQVAQRARGVRARVPGRQVQRRAALGSRRGGQVSHAGDARSKAAQPLVRSCSNSAPFRPVAAAQHTFRHVLGKQAQDMRPLAVQACACRTHIPLLLILLPLLLILHCLCMANRPTHRASVSGVRGDAVCDRLSDSRRGGPHSNLCQGAVPLHAC